MKKKINKTIRKYSRNKNFDINSLFFSDKCSSSPVGKGGKGSVFKANIFELIFNLTLNSVICVNFVNCQNTLYYRHWYCHNIELNEV